MSVWVRHALSRGLPPCAPCARRKGELTYRLYITVARNETRLISFDNEQTTFALLFRPTRDTHFVRRYPEFVVQIFVDTVWAQSHEGRKTLARERVSEVSSKPIEKIAKNFDLLPGTLFRTNFNFLLRSENWYLFYNHCFTNVSRIVWA